jgi:predicted MFS family arabinose efflux permease
MINAPAARLSYREALASGEFRALLLAQVVSVGGFAIASVALTILVYRGTASPLLASLTFALAFLPYLLGGGVLSAIVDRVRPRRLVARADFASALLVATMALPGVPLPIVFALLFAIGTLASVSTGARAALTRAAVSEDAYVPARSLLRIGAQLAQIVGNAGGGVLLVLVGTRGALLVSAGGFLLSASVVRLAVADHPHPGGAQSSTAPVANTRLVKDSVRGARTVLSNPELRRLLLVGWLVPMFSVAPEAVAAPYVLSHHGSQALVGWWLTALPIGLISGDLAGVRWLTAEQQRRIVGPVAIAGFLPYLAFVLNPSIAWAIALLVISGGCGMYVLGLDARVRDASPVRLFARTMTLSTSGLMALQGIGFALAGATAQALGPAEAITLAGVCGAASTTMLMRDDLYGILRRRRAVTAGRRSRP